MSDWADCVGENWRQTQWTENERERWSRSRSCIFCERLWAMSWKAFLAVIHWSGWYERMWAPSECKTHKLASFNGSNGICSRANLVRWNLSDATSNLSVNRSPLLPFPATQAISYECGMNLWCSQNCSTSKTIKRCLVWTDSANSHGVAVIADILHLLRLYESIRFNRFIIPLLLDHFHFLLSFSMWMTFLLP